MPTLLGDRQEFRRLAGLREDRLVEADEIDFAELPAAQKALAKAVGLKPVRVWSGVHGHIVEFEAPGHGQGGRFSKDMLQKLVRSSDFRWIELNSGGDISIGM
jgi:hypothetical protein